jgi:hypothetical protein
LQEKQVAWRRKLANWERGDFCLSESFTWNGWQTLQADILEKMALRIQHDL